VLFPVIVACITLLAAEPVQPCIEAWKVSVVAFPLPRVSGGLAVMVPDRKHVVVPFALAASWAPATPGEITPAGTPIMRAMAAMAARAVTARAFNVRRMVHLL
jgi:hypothetical protein